MDALATFRSHLRARLKSAGMNQAIFAARVGQQPSGISRMLSGAAGLDMDRADAWADALGLSGDERIAFMNCMAVAASPARVQTLVEELRQENTRLRAIVEKRKRQLDRLRALMEDD